MPTNAQNHLNLDKELRLTQGDKAPYTGFLVPRENWRLYQNFADENEALTSRLRLIEDNINKDTSSPQWIFFVMTFALGLTAGVMIPHH